MNTPKRYPHDTILLDHWLDRLIWKLYNSEAFWFIVCVLFIALILLVGAYESR